MSPRGYDLDGRVFVSLSNSGSGEVGDATRFHYRQRGDLVWAEYAGGAIVRGQLIARVLDDGRLDMRYQHVNAAGELRIGKCLSTPSRHADGRLMFDEQWQWLDADGASGHSVIVEASDEGMRGGT